VFSLSKLGVGMLLLLQADLLALGRITMEPILGCALILLWDRQRRLMEDVKLLAKSLQSLITDKNEK